LVKIYRSKRLDVRSLVGWSQKNCESNEKGAPMKTKKVKVIISSTGGLFTKVDNVTVIIESKSGIQKQVDVYVRANTLYASIGGGFVSLSASKYTSSTSYKWVELVPLNNHEFYYVAPQVGYLQLT
jgi:hypothetical protein